MSWNFIERDESFKTSINLSVQPLVIALIFERMQTPEGQNFLMELVQKTLPSDFKMPEGLEIKTVEGSGCLVTFKFEAPGYRVIDKNPMELPVENPFEIKEPYAKPKKKSTEKELAEFMRSVAKPSEKNDKIRQTEHEQEEGERMDVALSLLHQPRTAVSDGTYIIIRTEFGFHFYEDEDGLPGKKIGVSTHANGVASFFEDIEREMFNEKGVISRDHHPDNKNWKLIEY